MLFHPTGNVSISCESLKLSVPEVTPEREDRSKRVDNAKARRMVAIVSRGLCQLT